MNITIKTFYSILLILICSPISFANPHKKIFQNPSFRVAGIGVVTQTLRKGTQDMATAGIGLHIGMFVDDSDTNTIRDAMIDWSYNPVNLERNTGKNSAFGSVEAAHLGFAYHWSNRGCSPVTGVQGRFRSSVDFQSDLEDNFAYTDINAGLFCVKQGRAFLLTPFVGVGSENATDAHSNRAKLAYGGRAKVVIDNQAYAMVELVKLNAEDHLSTGEMANGHSTLVSGNADFMLTQNWYFAIRSDLSFMSLKGRMSGAKERDMVLSFLTNIGWNF